MHIYEEIIKKTEHQYSKLNHIIFEQILSDVEQYYNIKFPFQKEYLGTQKIHFLLLLPELRPYRRKFFELTKQYGMNQPSLWFDLIGIIFEVHLSEQERYECLEEIRTFPFCQDIEMKKSSCEITLESGKIEVYSGLKAIQNKQTIQLLKNYRVRGICHLVTSMLSEEFPNDYLTISEIPHCFYGSFYHSYITLEGEGIFDISNNTLYQGKSFEEFYKPKELVKVPGKEYLDRVLKLERTIGKPDDWPGILCLGLEEKRLQMQ